MPPDFILTSNTLQFGGAERQRVALANQLVHRGYRVQVRLLQETGPLRADLDSRVEVVVGPWYQPGTEASRTLLVTGTTNTEVGLGTLWAARNRRRGRWVVAHHHPAASDGPVFPRSLAAAVRRADGVIYLSAVHRRDHGRYQRLDAGRFWIVPNGVCDPPLPPARQDVGGPVRMVFTGRLIPVKRVDLLVRVLTEGMDDLSWTLDIYGDGPERQALEVSVPTAYADRIRFRGWSTDIPGVLSRAQVFTFPSDFEAQPMAVLEAMAAGLAIASNGVAAVPEMLADGAGIVVASQAVQDWRRVLRSLVGDPELRRRLGERARARARLHYSLSAMTDGYLTVRDSLDLGN
jgi:glycosyltransferase involved in cell wall biosynthesis